MIFNKAIIPPVHPHAFFSGEESFIDDDNSNLVNSIAAPSSATTSPVVSPTPASDVAETDHKLRKTKKNKRKKNSSSNDASVSSGGGASNSSGTLEGGVPFPTPRLEDDDSFELNTTYVWNFSDKITLCEVAPSKVCSWIG